MHSDRKTAWMALVALAAFAAAAHGAPAFQNAGFEDNGPGYNTALNTFKTPVASWTASGSAGVMCTNAGDAFTSGTGFGSQMVGMRMLGGITQTVSSFTVGSNYVVVWQGNSREAISLLEIVANGRYLWSDATKRNTGGFLSYTSRPFTATSDSLVLSFRGPNSADMTTLLDDLQLLVTTNAVISPCVDLWPMTGSASLGYATDPYGIAPYDGAAYIRCQGAVNATLTVRELQAGNSYRASFYARNRSAGSPNDFRVSVDGTVRLGGSGFTVSGTAWTNLTFDFPATGATASLKFESLLTLGGDRTVCFDGFGVQANASQPVTVTAIGTTAIGTTNATLRGVLDSIGGAENPQVTFCWGTTDGGTSSVGAWDTSLAMGTNWGVGQEFSTNVTGLLSGTGYCYRCFASNSAGTDWSDTAPCFTTRVLAVVSNGGAVVVDTAWAVVQGAVLSTGGDTPLVWLYYWPDSGAWTSAVALGAQGGAMTGEVANLASNTAYTCAFAASNAAGVAWSDTRGFTTPGWPTFVNPRFEDDGPGYNPNVNTFRAPVTNWTITGSGGALVGVMSTNAGDAYTGGKGARSQVLGICGATSASNRGVSQAVGGFTPGQLYAVAWEGNSRPTLNDSVCLSVAADGRVIWSDAISTISGAFLSYTSRPFAAPGTNVTLSFYVPFTNQDQTVLLDNLRILGATNGVTPFFDLYMVTAGGATHAQYPDAYGVAPYEGRHHLRIQFAGSAAMRIRELRPGRDYRVSYYAANRSGVAPNDFQVTVDGLVKTGGPNYTISGSGVWTNQAFSIISTGATASVTFQALNTPGGDRTIFFDGFGVEALPGLSGTIIMIE